MICICVCARYMYIIGYIYIYIHRVIYCIYHVFILNERQDEITDLENWLRLLSFSKQTTKKKKQFSLLLGTTLVASCFYNVRLLNADVVAVILWFVVTF